MLPILQIGPLSIQTTGLVILLGVWFAIGRVEKHTAKFAIKSGLLETLIMVSLAAGIVGARVGYVAQNPGSLSSGWLAILTPRPEMLDVLSGVFAGLVAGFLYGRKQRLDFWRTVDAVTPGAALFLVFIALAHLLSGNAYGMPTTYPWGIPLYGTNRHPSQIYELALAGAIFLWVEWRLRQQTPEMSNAGVFALQFVAASLGARILLETFRGDSTMIGDKVRLEQVIALVLLTACLWLLEKREGMAEVISAGEETAHESELPAMKEETP